MQKLIHLALAMLFYSSAQASNYVGHCATPKINIDKSGYLDLNAVIYIFDQPTQSSPKRRLTIFSTFSIAAQSRNGYVQLAIVPSDALTGVEAVSHRVIGWGRLSDFDIQDARNCS